MFYEIVFIVFICGFSNAASIFDGRIVGGDEVDISNYPYQLSLRSYGSHICGASIISKSWALTAAQCVDGVKDVSSITLVAATNLINGGGHVHKAAEIIEHPKYDILYKDYDIALIKVQEDFHIGDEENVIKLPDENDAIPEGLICSISGWGFTTDGGKLSEALQSVQVPIISLKECQDDYPTRDISKRDICAGLREGGRDFCDGDTGGPLVCNGLQVGIASWGFGCAMPNLPGVYTNVPEMRDWIREVTGL